MQLTELAAETIPDWYRFEFDSVHRRTLGPKRPAAGIGKLVKAIRGARRPGGVG